MIGGISLKYTDFIKNTVSKLRQTEFEALKKILVGEYITFAIISEEEITQHTLSEKLCDYFEKLELKMNKSFDKQIESYIKDIDSIVGKKIAKTPQTKKNNSTPIIVPRARKYYEKALNIRNSRNLSVRDLVDYSRIMFCLYTSILKNNGKEVTNIDFSIKVLNPKYLIDSMKTEQETLIAMKKNKFDIKDLYCSDTGTFIMTIILLHTILNDKVEGEYYHE